jgi:outer membrane lipoprotein carrier protein
MKKITVFAVLTTSVLMLAMPVFAAAPAIESALDTMQSFEADFVQSVSDDKIFRDERSSGSVWVQRPGKFFWRYDQGPQKIDIIADGVNLWIYQPNLKQVMVQQLADIEQDIPVSWLASDQPIGKRYNTRLLADSVRGLQWFDLQSKKGGSQEIAFIEIGMKDNLMQEVRLTSSDGKITLVTFSNAKRNTQIDPNKFIFRPPAGIDIIGTPQ